jgi:ricin-type beta-trefoil lectin protein
MFGVHGRLLRLRAAIAAILARIVRTANPWTPQSPTSASSAGRLAHEARLGPAPRRPGDVLLFVGSLEVTITASPNQTVDGNWSMGCSLGFSSGGSGGSFTATAPATRTLKLPFAHPDSCDVSAAGGLLNGVNDAGNAGNGGKVILYTCTRAENDRWTHRSNGEYVLESQGGKLCLTDPGQSTRNGTQLTVATCKNTTNQHWTLP